MGLCRAGLVEGLPHNPTDPPDNGLNAAYARTAVNLLRAEPQWASKKADDIWKSVMARIGSDPNKRANAQMDIVLTLWTAGLIRH